MLYVVETDPDGAVLSMTPCDNGVDEALAIIAEALTPPEDDVLTSVDVICGKWIDLCEASPNDPRVYASFVATRKHWTLSRFGLAVTE